MWGFPCCALLWSCWGFVMAAALCSSGAQRTPSSRAGLVVAGTVLTSSTALPSSDLRSAAIYGRGCLHTATEEGTEHRRRGADTCQKLAVDGKAQLQCNKVWQRGQKEQGLTLCWLSSPQSATQQCLRRKWLCYSHSKTEALVLWLLGLSSCLLIGCFQRCFIRERWKQQRLVALLFSNNFNSYILFTQRAKVYWALYRRWSTFSCFLLLICCNLFWSVMLQYCCVFCLLPPSISKAWWNRL